MSDTVCPSCGHRNAETSNFCSACGNRLEQDEHTIIFKLPAEGGTGEHDLGDLDADQAVLVVQRGPKAGSRFILDTDCTSLGRHPDSDIFLDDITVSRRHAEVRRAGSGFTVRDVGSLNGTYVNRERVEETALSNGDELQIGKFKLVFYPGT